MKRQEYRNHRHLVPLYHFLTFTAMAILLGLSIAYLVNHYEKSAHLGIMLVLMVLTIISVSFHCRSFALKVQDRAIRAEENLRYYMLTGKRLDARISLKQIIALRFAADEEFIPLVEETLKNNLSADQIKKSIRNWRGDYYRA